MKCCDEVLSPNPEDDSFPYSRSGISREKEKSVSRWGDLSFCFFKTATRSPIMSQGTGPRPSPWPQKGTGQCRVWPHPCSRSEAQELFAQRHRHQHPVHVPATLKAKASLGLQLAGKVKLVFHACVERLSLDYIVSHRSGKAPALARSQDLARLTGQNICWLCSRLSLD